MLELDGTLSYNHLHMKSPYIPKNFALPTTPEIDRAIQLIDEMVLDVGGAQSFLKTERHMRRNSSLFAYRVLDPLAYQMLYLEHRDIDSSLVDSEHKIANAALTGALFGHFINEAAGYPKIEQVRPYKRAMEVLPDLLGEYGQAYVDAGGIDTVEGYRFGATAMAQQSLRFLDATSLSTIELWGQETIYIDKVRPYFVLGVGMSLFNAWETYSE